MKKKSTLHDRHTDSSSKTIIGWKEWVALPELGISAIKAKVDTGARTSSLHAFDMEPFEENGVAKVRFSIHPLQYRTDVEVSCVANVVDRRTITNSGGDKEQRFVIRSPLVIGSNTWHVELTLTNRATMKFRMLLGRTTMHNRLIVDPTESFLSGRSMWHAYRRQIDPNKSQNK